MSQKAISWLAVRSAIPVAWRVAMPAAIRLPHGPGRAVPRVPTDLQRVLGVSGHPRQIADATLDRFRRACRWFESQASSRSRWKPRPSQQHVLDLLDAAFATTSGSIPTKRQPMPWLPWSTPAPADAGRTRAVSRAVNQHVVPRAHRAIPLDSRSDRTIGRDPMTRLAMRPMPVAPPALPGRAANSAQRHSGRIPRRALAAGRRFALRSLTCAFPPIAKLFQDSHVAAMDRRHTSSAQFR